MAFNSLVLPGGFEASCAYNQLSTLGHTPWGFRASAHGSNWLLRAHGERDPNAHQLWRGDHWGPFTRLVHGGQLH